MEKSAAGEVEESGRQKFREDCVGVRGEETNNRETGRPEGREETQGPQGWDDDVKVQGIQWLGLADGGIKMRV